MEFTLVAAALTAMTAMWLALRVTGRSKEFDRLLGSAVVGLAVGRLVAMVVAGVNPITHPLDVLVVRGGVSTVGASVGAIGALAWSARGELAALDRVAPAVVAGLAGWHGGCVWRNTCLGAAGDVPWGWALEGSSTIRHPVEIYTALLLLLAAWALSRLDTATPKVAGLALAAAGGARLVTQPLRPSLSGGPVIWYAAAIAVGALATGFGWYRGRRTDPAGNVRAQAARRWVG